MPRKQKNANKYHIIFNVAVKTWIIFLCNINLTLVLHDLKYATHVKHKQFKWIFVNKFMNQFFHDRFVIVQ